MLKYMGSCKEVARLSSKALDSKLTLSEKFGMKFHLFMCVVCRGYDNELRQLAELARRKQAESIDENREMGEERMDRVKTNVQQEIANTGE